MNFKEEDLEGIIADACQTEEGRAGLKERGLEIKGQVFRQLDLSPYGRADLVTVDYDGFMEGPVFTIYELKLDKISVKTLIQAQRYAQALRLQFGRMECAVRTVLVGKSIDISDWVFILDTLGHTVDIYLYEYGWDGIYFHKQPKEWSKDGEFNKDTDKQLRDCISKLKREYNKTQK